MNIFPPPIASTLAVARSERRDRLPLPPFDKQIRCWGGVVTGFKITQKAAIPAIQVAAFVHFLFTPNHRRHRTNGENRCTPCTTWKERHLYL